MLLHPLAHLLVLLPVFLLPVKRAVTCCLALAALHFKHIFPLGRKSLSREADGQNRWNRSEEELDEPALTPSLLIREKKDYRDKNAHSKLGEVIGGCCVGKVVLREDARTAAADDRLLSVRGQRHAARDLILACILVFPLATPLSESGQKVFLNKALSWSTLMQTRLPTSAPSRGPRWIPPISG